MLNHHSSDTNSDGGGVSNSRSSSISGSAIGAIIPPLGTNTNQHGYPGIDISGFEFPSGFSFGGTIGSIIPIQHQQQQHSDFNELTASFSPPSSNQPSKHNNIHQQQFDTYSIDGSNSDNNNHHLHHHHLSSDNIDDPSLVDATILLHFGTDNNTIVTSQTGSMALLPCIVNNIGDGMVSWIRRKDYHLLTVGLTTYNSDERFQAIHLQHSEDWTLQIKFVQRRDAGLYECQVSSHPPQSIFVQLDVVEARAEIQGPSEKFLKPGSSLRLQCTVVQSTELPLYVFWYHNNRMINYDLDRGINVTTELAAKVSTLSITSATTKHTGNYTCVPSNAQPASTYVHILNGENPAAMQHGGRGLSWLRCPSAWLLIFSVIFSVIITISS